MKSSGCCCRRWRRRSSAWRPRFRRRRRCDGVVGEVDAAVSAAKIVVILVLARRPGGSGLVPVGQLDEGIDASLLGMLGTDRDASLDGGGHEEEEEEEEEEGKVGEEGRGLEGKL